MSPAGPTPSSEYAFLHSLVAWVGAFRRDLWRACRTPTNKHRAQFLVPLLDEAENVGIVRRLAAFQHEDDTNNLNGNVLHSFAESTGWHQQELQPKHVGLFEL